MPENRPSIPEQVKREVRKICGFGCAICGMPFFQYDHVEEFADVKEHTVENLVLLCPNHHAAKTTKKLSKERIVEARKKPFNKDKTLTSSFNVEPSKELLIQLGSNIVTGWHPEARREHHSIWINGQSFFTIHNDEGYLTISMVLTDENGDILLLVKKGELLVSTAAWDYKYEGQNILIRAGLGDILLNLNLSDTKVEILKGIFLDKNLDGFRVDNGSLITLLGGESIGTFRNVNWRAYGEGDGGIGLLNARSAPHAQRLYYYTVLLEYTD